MTMHSPGLWTDAGKGVSLKWCPGRKVLSRSPNLKYKAETEHENPSKHQLGPIDHVTLVTAVGYRCHGSNHLKCYIRKIMVLWGMVAMK